MATSTDYIDTKHWRNLPAPKFDNIFNLFKDPDELYAPDWWRTMIAGTGEGARDRMPWATKSWQALTYGGLLGLLGYGTRKLLRGSSGEAQDAMKAMDKYLPMGEDPAKLDKSRLVAKKDYVSMKDKFKNALKRAITFKEGADEFNTMSYVLPPATAFMMWLVGQKLAEKEIEHTDLSDSRARLAKARSDYNRALAMKLNPKARVEEQVISDRLQNPVDYAIDKGIELKDKAVANVKDKLFEAPKQAAEPAVDTRPNWKSDEAVKREELRKQVSGMPNVALAMKYITEHIGLTPFLMMFGAASFLGGGIYGYNNQRAGDKGFQKALDKEAAIKRRAMEMNDQRLDMTDILPGVRKKKPGQTGSIGTPTFSF